MEIRTIHDHDLCYQQVLPQPGRLASGHQRLYVAIVSVHNGTDSAN